MVGQLSQPDEAATDLEKTDELPSLDLAAYEGEILAAEAGATPAAVPAVESAVDERRATPLPVLPVADTLRDIEAWIAQQDERTHAYERTLDEVQRARADAQARAENLAVELEIAQKALHTALCRANDGERAALDNAAMARAAEARLAQLASDLEAARRESGIGAERAAAGESELSRTRESLVAKSQEHEQLQQRESELAKALETRAQRISELERELATLRTQFTDLGRELQQRSEHLASAQAASVAQQATTGELTRERDALAARIAKLTERFQARHWKRGFWESMWQELDTQLADAHQLRNRVECERSDFAARVDQMTAQLVERDATIVQLKSHSAGQVSALEELATTRSRELQEIRSIGETLATEFKSLEERHRSTSESLALRETELAEAHATHAGIQGALEELKASEAASRARVSEFEALAAELVTTLQAQTESAQRAAESLSARERELADEHTRATIFEAELQAATHTLAAQAASIHSSNSALANREALLAAAQERLSEFEREANQQSERLAGLLAERDQAKVLAAEAHAARLATEADLNEARGELHSQSARVVTLDAAQRELALELERTRGALDERDLQLRRLERYANSSAQVLSRIRIGIERGEPSRRVDALPAAESDATLVPLNDSNAPPLPLGRHTTVGRAPESDVCLRDTSVSRRHAVITIGPNGAFIEDLRSVNGVKLNRQRIRHARLADGDVIELGSKLFRFTTPAAKSADAV